ncbi:MAG: right-handed parallel beta-helix repeat-containing protein, partial [Candidatus Heimdallarchaeaceae archaeon]
GVNLAISKSSNCIIENNTLNNADYGFSLSSSSYMKVKNNNISLNERDGLSLRFCYSVFITNNTFFRNNYTIPHGDYVIPEKIKGTGIRLVGSNSCLITFNLFTENRKYAIDTYDRYGWDRSSYNNLIYHNWFIDNNPGEPSQSFDDGFSNLWYSPTLQKGNFWSGWNKANPYPIDGDAESFDRYPLDKNFNLIEIFIYPSDTSNTNYIFIVVILSLLSVSYIFYKRIV